MLILFLDLAAVSASFVPGPETNTSRQRHAPLYGRLVAEEHLPASHRDAVHQVRVYCRLAVCARVPHQRTSTHPAHFDLIALQPPRSCLPPYTHTTARYCIARPAQPRQRTSGPCRPAYRPTFEVPPKHRCASSAWISSKRTSTSTK